ncbi:MAG: aspartate ammonia-lyase [Firmicutes bacterium]|nr:aspartate ammonia-lyase [Bacillota bacterium]
METIKKIRIESDSVGEKEVPPEAYYGIQTLRAMENFPITGRQMAPEYVKAMALLKKACAILNCEAGIIKEDVAKAIISTCEEIMDGKYYDQFLVDPVQGSAGTSYNMNMNEVVANIANEKLGGGRGDYTYCTPNDHVNNGQSTNDIVPTAGKIALLWLLRPLEKNLADLRDSFLAKAKEFDGVIKMGRTQMQDAVPIRLGQEFNAYATALTRALGRIKDSEKELFAINMGGSAIGTGINADLHYFHGIGKKVAELTGEPFYQAEDLVDGTMHTDCYAMISGALKSLAIVLNKICADLRIMSSGPATGFGEIHLPERQNGSSIMPGKINPVMTEVVTQVGFKVIGNDVTVTLACEGGQLELNAFEPITFYSLFESIQMLTNVMPVFKAYCVDGIEANADHCRELMEKSVGMATALNPYIGYKASAKLIKDAKAHGKTLKQEAYDENILPHDQLDEILDPMAMTTPGIAGRK